jgi:sn-glycerol 3-phosphate transport system substrate-binding protein
MLDAMMNRLKVTPPGVSDANACTSAFFAGHTGMMVLSTGSLSFVRENMKTPYRVAFMPRNLRNAAPIGGASLILPKGNSPERQAAAWTLISWLTSPEIAGEWSRFTGYFAPRKAAYDLPEMKEYLQQHPGRQGRARPAAIRRTVVRHLQHGRGTQSDRGPGPGDPVG